MFLRIAHLTRYDYSAPVSFAPHALYLRPRETPRQRLHDFRLDISPAARCIATTDPLDNALDWAHFTDQPHDRLEFRSELMVETLDTNPFDFFPKPTAFSVPFTYDRVEYAALLPCLTPRLDSPPSGQLQAWLAQHFPNPPTETVPFLVALNSAVHRALRYRRREEPGIQSAAQTMADGGGSCRDYAVFLIELLRVQGIAARFVSGYLYEPAVTGAPALPPAMHAWVEVYLPGAGWRGLDPTRGIFCDDAFVPLAHAASAESVNPIQGNYYLLPNVTSKLTTVLSIERL